MSIQPLTSLVAVGLLALLLSCSGEDQVGYDVKLDFIPPTETDASDPRPDLEVAVALSPSNPSYTLSEAIGDFDGSMLSRWTSELRREAQRRSDGMEPGFAMAMDQHSFTADGTVDFLVRVFSWNGYVSGRNRGYVPTSPASCAFTLEPAGATGQDYADNVNQCLSDWVAENGVPMVLDMEVTSTGASSPAIKSGFARKATASTYMYEGDWEMSSPECDETKSDCCDSKTDDKDVLAAVEEGGDIFGLLDCSTLMLTGEGTIDPSEDPVSITVNGGADIWDACGTSLSGATMADTPLDGPGTYTVNGSGSSMGADFIGDVDVKFEPAEPAQFYEALLAAANGICAPGGGPATEAYAKIDWEVCGDTPRSGRINVVANGTCELVSP